MSPAMSRRAKTAGASPDLSLLPHLEMAVPGLLPAGRALALRLLGCDLAATSLMRLPCLKCIRQARHQL